MSNCIFNFNFLALVLSEILGGPKFTLGCPVLPVRPLAETFFVPKASNLEYLIAFLISAFQLQQFLRYQGVPKLHEGPCATCTPLAEIFFIPKSCISQYIIAFLIVTFQLQYQPRYQGIPQLQQRALRPLDPWMPPSGKIFIPKTITLLYLIAF